jgi:glycosyltransferase involved in cell wall biosynthesis
MAIRLAVASAYPPNRRPLSEYAWHVVDRLCRNHRVDHVHVLAERGQDTATLHDRRISVHQCWSFGGIDQPFSVARAARALKVDAVWFHMHMTSGGNSRMSQCAGVVAPAVCRLSGVPTIVTLHNMLGLTDLKWARPQAKWFDVVGAHLATTLLRIPDAVCVLLPEYAELLRSRYGVNARVMPMGTLGTPKPPLDRPLRPSNTVLAFGHFGSYKRLEVVVDAVRELNADGQRIKLIVAGTDSRQAPGYLAGMRRQCADASAIEFLGYVPEHEIPALFEQAAACILPFATVTGMSSVATQAAMYGLPIIASDIPGTRLFEKHGLRINFFDWPDAQSLAQVVRHVLASPAHCREDAAHNLRYCRGQLMDDVVSDYVDIIEALVAAKADMHARSSY